MTAVAKFRSPIGLLAIEATDEGVCGLSFGGGGRAKAAVSAPAQGHIEDALRALESYFDGVAPKLPKLDLQGSEFQLRVWEALLAIPFGELVTYGELARRIGVPGAARAVGGANHENPVPILVPCHRVVAAGGRLGGYGGGTAIKARLLALEAAHVPALRP